MFRAGSLALAVVFLACDAKGPPLVPELGDGKADIADRVSLRGALAFEEPATGTFTEDLEFHGYLLDARPGAVATIEITQLGTSRALDTTLLVYGPRSPAGAYGSDEIAMDDDSGWGDQSRLRDLELADGGRYLVVVGTHDGRGRGDYRLRATCPSGDCAAPTGACPLAATADIETCVADMTASAEAATMSAIDALDVCAGSVGLSAELAEACRWELDDRYLDAMCVLGEWFTDAYRLPWLHVTAEREISSGAGLDALTRAQLVAAVRSAGFDDVDTVAEGLAVVDGGTVHRVEVWDASARHAFTAYEFGAGDTSLGLYFAHGTTDTVATINDSNLLGDCAHHPGAEGRACRTADDCPSAGLTCLGVAAESGRGRCVDLATPTAGEGDVCDGEVGGDCPPASGLVCAGLTREPDGVCLPAWTRGRYASRPLAAIPDASAAGARAELVVSGLAELDSDVEVRAFIPHERPGDLRVSLVAPDGQEAVLFDGPADAPFLELHQPVVFGAPVAVNGAWTLVARDDAAGATGSIERFDLLIGSRPD